MPAEPVPQPCEVCGVETTSKCAACESAGISLFSCSRDHQKLVWPAHKLVCGPGKALPFAMLPLLDSDIAQVKKLLDKSSASSLAKSFRAALEELGQAPAEAVLESINGDVYDIRRLPHKPFIVCLVRSILWQLAGPEVVDAVGPHLYSIAVNDEDRKTFNVDVASGLCASLLSGMCADLRRARVLPLDYSRATWFSLFQHKLFFICRRGQLVSRRPHDVEANAHYRGATERTNAWLWSGMGTGEAIFSTIGGKAQIVHEVETYERPQ
ncbi:hypothetical protein JCM3775_005843 [Rhodotorula graminis]